MYNLGPSLVHLGGGRPVTRRASSLWVIEFIVGDHSGGPSEV